MSRAAAQFRILTAESLLDAMRRRVVAVIAIASLLALWLVEGCTDCEARTFAVGGGGFDPTRIAGFSGVLSVGALALWTIILAGILAADHLKETLRDGSSELVLSRPVGRTTFVLSRLTGALALSLGTGALLLATTTALLAARHGLAPGPALAAGAACAAGAVAVGALAMTISLVLPRIATFLLVFLLVATMTGLHAAAAAGLELSGFYAALDRFGPPFAAGIARGLAGWIGRDASGAGSLELAMRLALWAVGSVALLAVAFRRIELPR